MRPLFNDRQTKCKSLSETKRLTGSTVWLSLSFGLPVRASLFREFQTSIRVLPTRISLKEERVSL